MNTEFRVVLDTCVLVPMALCDTLLRLAERRLYLPLWSRQTMIELERALVQKIGLTSQKATKRTNAIAEFFQDSFVDDIESLIPSMLNDLKDRHVTAAAVHSGAELIVTLNLKHFPPLALSPFNIEAKHPDRFLCELFGLHSEQLIHCLHEQATDISRDLPALLRTLKGVVPDLAHMMTEYLQTGDSPDVVPESAALSKNGS